MIDKLKTFKSNIVTAGVHSLCIKLLCFLLFFIPLVSFNVLLKILVGGSCFAIPSQIAYRESESVEVVRFTMTPRPNVLLVKAFWYNRQDLSPPLRQ